MHTSFAHAQRILETTRHPFLVVDAELRVVSANRAFLQLFGLTFDDVRGAVITALDEGTWCPPALNWVLQDVSRGVPEIDALDLSHVFPRVGERDLVVSARPLPQEAPGQPVLILLGLEDVTARRAAERTAALATVELLRSNTELQEFATIASHDLQEPLRKIEAFGTRLHRRLGRGLDDESQADLSRMLAACGRMRALVEGLLTYSRLGEGVLRWSSVDLQAIVADVLTDLAEAIARDDAQFDVGPLPVIEADPSQVRQLIQNLLSNALKFRRPDVAPRIRIAAELTPAECRLTIADNGIGLEPRHTERIFGMFARLHSRDRFAGTGIGLSVCRRIVERHGGRIQAFGKPNGGATFVVVLPKRQQRT